MNKHEQTQFFRPEQKSTISDHIQVYVRLKPLTEIELSQQRVRGGAQWHVINDKTLAFRQNLKDIFHFDQVFDDTVTTQALF